MKVRPPAVAGAFYPATASDITLTLAECHAGAVAAPADAAVPEAIVVPHAGLQYSGPIAASAYQRLLPARSSIRRVVLLGPAHRVAVDGLALSGADTWSTPLGSVALYPGAAEMLADLPYVVVDDRAHASEHSLEVQLPFLQTMLDDFELIPLVVGDATVEQVATVVDRLWVGPDTIVVVSTDLSHFHAYDEANLLDGQTAAAIVEGKIGAIDDLDACGARPLRGLLKAAGNRNLTVQQIDLRNSGDTAGNRERVVGYGAFALV